jgi:hypothetical protein
MANRLKILNDFAFQKAMGEKGYGNQLLCGIKKNKKVQKCENKFLRDTSILWVKVW